MDDSVNINAVSLNMLSGEAQFELDECVDKFGIKFKVNVLGQIFEQAEHQYYDALADLFLESTSLENRKNFTLKNRVRKFAKKSREAGLPVPNMVKLEAVCEEKLRARTNKMPIWL